MSLFPPFQTWPITWRARSTLLEEPLAFLSNREARAAGIALCSWPVLPLCAAWSCYGGAAALSLLPLLVLGAQSPRGPKSTTQGFVPKLR